MRPTYRQYQKLQELRFDYLNLANCWLYSVLYYNQVYPLHTFQFKTVHGVTTPVSASQKVQDYIKKFFTQIDNNLLVINHIEVEIKTEHGEFIRSYRLFAGIQRSQFYNTRHQKQTEFKSFLSGMIESLKKTPVDTSPKTFSLLVQYRNSKMQKTKSGRFLDNWLHIKNISSEKECQESLVGSSLKLNDMNIMAIKIEPKFNDQ